MTIENQVCTLEQAKKLNELGVNTDSLFRHLHLPKTIYRKGAWVIADKVWLESATDPGESFAAYTVAELGVMLAGNYTGFNGSTKYIAEFEHRTVDPERRNKGTGTTRYLTYHNTEAEARAAMLIYLLENGLTTAEEVNQRLTQNQ